MSNNTLLPSNSPLNHPTDKAWKRGMGALRRAAGFAVSGLHWETRDGDAAQLRSRQVITEETIRSVFDSPTLQIGENQTDDYHGNTRDLSDRGGFLSNVDNPYLSSGK